MFLYFNLPVPWGGDSDAPAQLSAKATGHSWV